MDLPARLPHLFPPLENLTFFGHKGGSKETLTNEYVGVGLGEVRWKCQ